LQRQEVAQKVDDIGINRYGDQGNVEYGKKDKIKPLPFRAPVKQEGGDETRNSDDKSN
jgi:hypothetical protein